MYSFIISGISVMRPNVLKPIIDYINQANLPLGIRISRNAGHGHHGLVASIVQRARKIGITCPIYIFYENTTIEHDGVHEAQKFTNLFHGINIPQGKESEFNSDIYGSITFIPKSYDSDKLKTTIIITIDGDPPRKRYIPDTSFLLNMVPECWGKLWPPYINTRYLSQGTPNERKYPVDNYSYSPRLLSEPKDPKECDELYNLLISSQKRKEILLSVLYGIHGGLNHPGDMFAVILGALTLLYDNKQIDKPVVCVMPRAIDSRVAKTINEEILKRGDGKVTIPIRILDDREDQLKYLSQSSKHQEKQIVIMVVKEGFKQLEFNSLIAQSTIPAIVQYNALLDCMSLGIPHIAIGENFTHTEEVNNLTESQRSMYKQASRNLTGETNRLENSKAVAEFMYCCITQDQDIMQIFELIRKHRQQKPHALDVMLGNIIKDFSPALTYYRDQLASTQPFTKVPEDSHDSEFTLEPLKKARHSAYS